MSDRKPCKSDLSDERWALIEPVSTAWNAWHPSASGHGSRYEMREIVNALLHQSRTGCRRDRLSHKLPPRGAVHCSCAEWRDDGAGQVIHNLLRRPAREEKGRSADPGLVVLDPQSLHAAAGTPADTTGRNTAKKVPSRELYLDVDVSTLVDAVVVLAAFVHDDAAGTALPGKVAIETDTVQKALVDQGLKNTVAAHGEQAGIEVEVIRRNPAGTGFTPPARTVDGGADQRDLDAAPAAGPGARAPPRHRRVAGVPGDKRCDGPSADRRLRLLARRMSGDQQTPGALAAHLEPRERQVAAESGAARDRSAEPTALLSELDQAAEHIKITPKTLLELPGEVSPAPVLPESPARRQIPAVLAEAAIRCGHGTCARRWTWRA